jgi:hypothetical protein
MNKDRYLFLPVTPGAGTERGRTVTFIVTSERDKPPIRYEKVGRLRPGEEGMIDVITDGNGVIRSIPTGDLILMLNGLLFLA